MNTVKNHRISFQHFVPTEPLVKAALGIHKFEDAKLLNNSVGIMTSGHISFYKRAINIAKNILEKNPELRILIEEIAENTSVEQQLDRIKNYVHKYGECIDVVI